MADSSNASQEQKRLEFLAMVRERFYESAPTRAELHERIESLIRATDGLPAPATVAWRNHSG